MPDIDASFRPFICYLLSVICYLPTRSARWQVCPLPRSLATTCGISVDVFSSPYLDVSVRAVPLIRLWIQRMIPGHCSRGVSPFGYLRIYAYLPLPVAFRSLSRPSSAPSAKAFPLCSSSLDLQKLCGQLHLPPCKIVYPFGKTFSFRFLLLPLNHFHSLYSVFKVQALSMAAVI